MFSSTYRPIARDRLLCDPMRGHLFLFSNSQRDRVRILHAGENGLWVCAQPLVVFPNAAIASSHRLSRYLYLLP
ncbi:MAG: IS66 family insertion sequence element accessory protein TnpB [Acidobacteriaceae bacterium]